MLQGEHLDTSQRTLSVIGHGSTQGASGGRFDNIGRAEDSFVGRIRQRLFHAGRQRGKWCAESAMRKEVLTSVCKSLIWCDPRALNTHSIEDRSRCGNEQREITILGGQRRVAANTGYSIKHAIMIFILLTRIPGSIAITVF